MTIDDILKSIMEKLITLPDQVGLARCAGFYLLYQGLETLKTRLENERNEHQTEVKALQERIRELEQQVNTKE